MLNWLLVILIILTIIAAYVFWIRPALKLNPKFAEIYAREESFWAALGVKFKGIKQKLVTAFVMIAGFVVTSYDSVVSLAAQVGFDWGNVSTLTSKVPPAAWPVIGMVLIGTVQYFRNLSDKRVEQIATPAAAEEIAKAG